MVLIGEGSVLEEDPGGFEMSGIKKKSMVSLTRFKVSLEGFIGHIEGFRGFQRGLEVSPSRL